jgi:hypothetical protein
MFSPGAAGNRSGVSCESASFQKLSIQNLPAGKREISFVFAYLDRADRPVLISRSFENDVLRANGRAFPGPQIGSTLRRPPGPPSSSSSRRRISDDTDVCSTSASARSF